MFGSVGSIAPRNYAEFCALTGMMLVGSSIWAWVIGSLCGILATLDPHATAFRNLMDELNFFMRMHSFDADHRVRLREFFRQVRVGRARAHTPVPRAHAHARARAIVLTRRKTTRARTRTTRS